MIVVWFNSFSKHSGICSDLSELLVKFVQTWIKFTCKICICIYEFNAKQTNRNEETKIICVSLAKNGYVLIDTYTIWYFSSRVLTMWWPSKEKRLLLLVTTFMLLLLLLWPLLCCSCLLLLRRSNQQKKNHKQKHTIYTHRRSCNISRNFFIDFMFCYVNQTVVKSLLMCWKKAPAA